MGSPLGPTLCDENIWLENYTYDLLITHLHSWPKDHVVKFKNYPDKLHKNIKFSSEIEKNCSLSSLDIAISSENNKFT